MEKHMKKKNQQNNVERTQKPEFGKNLGLWYPLFWRILDSHEYWSLSHLFAKKSALGIDIYIGTWWVVEIFGAILCGSVFSWHPLGDWILMVLLCYRFFDIIFVLESTLLKGFYRNPYYWLSANRIMLLAIINAIEIMYIFAVFYRVFGILYPVAAGTEPILSDLFNALYFSVVTGTTLGYGKPHPIGWLSQLLVILETISIVLVVVVLVGYVASSRRRPKNLEAEEQES